MRKTYFEEKRYDAAFSRRTAYRFKEYYDKIHGTGKEAKP